MAYEYEKENIRKLKSYNVLSGGANITKPIDELQEVYQKARLLDDIVITTKKRLSEQECKAKAWDKYIAEVRERARFTENTEDDIERETKKVVDYFMEDE
ncbi:hypothetical protein [Staphylococcus equorum]|uniref:hypothetical protein n=1 Tax=Staphylococcus equorum TaxID=246432 RepID=UPI00192D04E8|nr:hypothetical protein [Staphylococcus equorum]